MLLACAELARPKKSLVRSLLMSKMQRLQMLTGGLTALLGVSMDMTAMMRVSCEALVVVLRRIGACEQKVCVLWWWCEERARSRRSSYLPGGKISVHLVAVAYDLNSQHEASHNVRWRCKKERV